jgi:hypothetical protein
VGGCLQALSGEWHEHFVDLYGAFKLGFMSLSVKDKKSPVEYEKGEEVVDEYVETLNNLLRSDAKKHMSKRWWSQDAVEMLFPLHLAYILMNLAVDKQQVGWPRNHWHTRQCLRWISLMIWQGRGRAKRMNGRMLQSEGKLLQILKSS